MKSVSLRRRLLTSMMWNGFALLTITSAAEAQATSAPSLAESTPPDEDDGSVAEIVVTAERRTENIQRVPISIAAVNGDRLASAGITDTQSLSAMVPGLSTSANLGFARPYLRGIGSSGNGASIESPVAVYVDGVYYAVASANIFGLNNLERIEVLKGPQGTLFGRNATGGVIQILTKDPTTTTEAQAEVGYGNYEAWRAGMYIAGGSEKVAASLSVQAAGQGQGYGTNFFDGSDAYRLRYEHQARGKAIIKPSDKISLRIVADYIGRKDSTFGYRPTNDYQTRLYKSAYDFSSRPWDINDNSRPINNFKGGGASAQIDVQLNGFEIVNLIAYRQSRSQFSLDFDASPAIGVGALVKQRDTQFSNEFQIRSTGNGNLTWIGGLYYIDIHSRYDPHYTEIGPPNRATLAQRYFYTRVPAESAAVFGQVGWRFAPNTRLTMGGRYTWETRKLDALTHWIGIPIPDTTNRAMTKASEPTWRVAIDHQFTDAALAYASYNRGFKSGGFSAAAPADPPFQPERIDAYEAGLKTTLLDRKVRLNMAGFYYDYQNLQVGFGNQTTNAIQIVNAASARTYGLDVDFDARVTRSVSVYGGFEWLNAKFVKYERGPFNGPAPVPPGGSIAELRDLSGNRTPFAPKFAANLGAEFKTNTSIGSFVFAPLANYNSGYFGEADNNLHQNRFMLFNASLAWRASHGGVGASLWINNITNQAIAQTLAVGPYSSNAVYLPPRTYGIKLTLDK